MIDTTLGPAKIAPVLTPPQAVAVGTPQATGDATPHAPSPPQPKSPGRATATTKRAEKTTCKT